MISRCAWCDSPLGADAGAPEDAPISHGMCARCEREFVGTLGMSMHRFLESLGAPVAVVDVEAGGRAITVNSAMAELTEKDSSEVTDQLLGDVFECANASLPEGCGRTIHCSGCAIRNAVEHTWKTGEARVRVPATLRADGGDEAIAMLISTERTGDRVLMRIDRYRATGGGGS